MKEQARCGLRLALGLGAAVLAGYGFGWPLGFLTPIYAAFFLVLPVWIGWNNCFGLLVLMAASLLVGLVISEYFLILPLACLLVYGLLFFAIYYLVTPAAPPMAAMFMTIGITILPLMGLSQTIVAHFLAAAMLGNLAAGLGVAWFFHRLLPGSPLASGTAPPGGPAGGADQGQRIRIALASTLVALTALALFFSRNLAGQSYAMLQICFLAGNTSPTAPLTTMKKNLLGCLLGGLAILVVHPLLLAWPNLAFLIALVVATSLLFAQTIYGGTSMGEYGFLGLVTFLVLLGTSTLPGGAALDKLSIRVAQIVFAGLYAVAGLYLAGRLLGVGKR